MSKAINQEDVQDALSLAFGLPPEEAEDKSDSYDLTWEPNLNPVQRRVYLSQADYILSYGERGTGKSHGGLHKLVHHCVFNNNAIAFVLVKEVGQAKEGGAWDKLIKDVLPAWKYGNYDRVAKKRVDQGVGIEYTEPKYGVSDKKPYIWVRNCFGGWSLIILISLFVGEQVGGKVKGKEPSFVFFDEAQTTDSDVYFSELAQQVGRNSDVEGKQQIVYSCNPKGPSHWLYQVFFCHGEDVDGDGHRKEWPIDEQTGHPVNPETGELLKEFAVFHVPIQENIQNLRPGYWERVLTATRNDPIEKARMIDGEWIDKPDGSALFRDYWSDQIHLKGDYLKGKGIRPIPGHFFITSWDPGSAHSSIHMMQFIPTAKKTYWLVFDELNFVGQYMHYGLRDASGNITGLVPTLIDQMKYWEDLVGTTFNFVHISDSSAFNQFRATTGSYDVQYVESVSKLYVKENGLPERYIIKMKECPKGPHSVEARVRLLTDLLIEQSILVSTVCPKTRDMFMKLEEDKDDRMKPRRSKHLHPFDSLTYGPFYYQSGRGRSQIIAPQSERLEPAIYSVGGK